MGATDGWEIGLHPPSLHSPSHAFDRQNLPNSAGDLDENERAGPPVPRQRSGVTEKEHWRIAVIADTHNRWPAGFPPRLQTADEIWHLGDVCRPETLDELVLLSAPLTLVRGNNDEEWTWPLTRQLERRGWRFHLEHIPPARAPEGCHYLLHGHTHVPFDEQRGRCRWLNPGALSLAHRGAPASFAWLQFHADAPPVWQLERV